MRLVIVTGAAPHHRNLCAALHSKFNAVGVIHPAKTVFARRNRISKFLRRVAKHGLITSLSNAVASVIQSRNAGSSNVDPDGIPQCSTIPENKIIRDCDVSSRTALDIIQDLRPDVTVFLGGPVYPAAFIAKAGRTFNFHSGISPIYNGTSSILFAFANAHLSLCGGTLMKMSAAVDGGAILGHYLPAVAPGDTPSSLFQKTVGGAITMYDRLLSHISCNGIEANAISQPPALFYTRAIDFSWHHARMIAAHLRQDIAARFQRPASILEYWRAASPHAARESFDRTLARLLWNSVDAK